MSVGLLYMTVKVACHDRLWGTIDREASAVDIANNREELQTCCDGIATGAFVKVSSYVDGVFFILWWFCMHSCLGQWMRELGKKSL